MSIELLSGGGGAFSTIELPNNIVLPFDIVAFDSKRQYYTREGQQGKIYDKSLTLLKTVLTPRGIANGYVIRALNEKYAVTDAGTTGVELVDHNQTLIKTMGYANIRTRYGAIKENRYCFYDANARAFKLIDFNDNLLLSVPLIETNSQEGRVFVNKKGNWVCAEMNGSYGFWNMTLIRDKDLTTHILKAVYNSMMALDFTNWE